MPSSPANDWQSWEALGFDTHSRWEQLTFLKDSFLPTVQGAALLEEMGIHLWNQKEIGLREDYPFAPEGSMVQRIFVRTGETADGPGRSMHKGESAALEISWRDTNGFYIRRQQSRRKAAHRRLFQWKTVFYKRNSLAVHK